ncbi:MAG: biopolymer transporter ExbD, partial [Pseudomonadota bacterium]
MAAGGRAGQEGGGEGEIDLTPMLDVVFIMLIFFIVTSSFVKEPGVDINKVGAITT